MSELSKLVWRHRIALWSSSLALLTLGCNLGGSLYEHLVLDPVWPQNAALIQPQHGGIDRKAFWIPIHAVLSLSLLTTVIGSWKDRIARKWALIGAGLYLVLRIWTIAYFVPLTLRFEGGDRTLSPDMLALAREWVWLSLLRLPLVGVTALAVLFALRRLLHLAPASRGAVEPRQPAHARP